MKLLMAIFWVLLSLQVGSEINFEPKLLSREVKRISGSPTPTAKEIMAYKTGKFFTYTNGNPVSFSYVGRVYTCRSVGCKVSDDSVDANGSEYFDYFILFDRSGKILSIQIYNFEATHGQEITLKSWLNQFVGYNGKNTLTVGKEIDVISGATTSVNRLTDDVIDKTRKLQDILHKQS